MEFPTAFFLLQNKLGSFSDERGRESASQEDILSVAEYLGISVNPSDKIAACSSIKAELSLQNKFLTKKLRSNDVFSSEIYLRSKFGQDIIRNNREE